MEDSRFRRVGQSDRSLADSSQVTRIVDDDGQASTTSCEDPLASFATVSAAIAAAAAGDTVLVCPGTYV